MSMSDIHFQLLKLQSFQRKSYMYLQKIMLVDNIHFFLFSTLKPDEFQMVESTELLFLPSTAYAYFLNFLCHYHLNNVRQFHESLQGLQLVIDESYLIEHRVSKRRAVMFLRIALQLLDNNTFA